MKGAAISWDDKDSCVHSFFFFFQLKIIPKFSSLVIISNKTMTELTIDRDGSVSVTLWLTTAELFCRETFLPLRLVKVSLVGCGCLAGLTISLVIPQELESGLNSYGGLRGALQLL